VTSGEMPQTCIQKQYRKQLSPGDFEVHRKEGVQLETSPNKHGRLDQTASQCGVGVFDRVRSRVE
jgi:hypothetical protein